MSGRIPLILVTGFLGSGKTTLLRELAAAHPDWRMIFLVNEFADRNIDQLTLDTSGQPTQSVVGGSLFCECKAGEFVRVMKEAVVAAHRKNPLDAVVVETSGIADPQAISSLLRTHGLDRSVEIRRIVTVVAPKRFLRLLANLPNVGAQVRSSDLVLLNKTDLASEKELVAIEAVIRQHNPSAEIRRSTFCKVPLDLLQEARELPDADLSTVEANPFTTALLSWPRDRPLAEAKAWLEGLPESILRVKGGIATPEGFHTVEGTVDSLSITEADNPGKDTLVLIAHDRDASVLERVIQEVQTTP